MVQVLENFNHTQMTFFEILIISSFAPLLYPNAVCSVSRVAPVLSVVPLLSPPPLLCPIICVHLWFKILYLHHLCHPRHLRILLTFKQKIQKVFAFNTASVNTLKLIHGQNNFRIIIFDHFERRKFPVDSFLI